MPDPSHVLGGHPDVLERVVADERDVLRELGGERVSDIDEDERRAVALWRLGNALFKLRRFAEAVEPLEEAERAAALIPGWDSIVVGARLQ